MKLIKDIQSSFNPKTIYAKAGEEVELINKKGIVWIVRKPGEKDGFPVLKIYVSEDDKAVILTQHIEQSVPDTTAIINRVSVSKTKKAKPLNQKELF